MDSFIPVFAAFGAECLDKLKGGYNFENRVGFVKTIVSERLPLELRDRFETNKRCSFSFTTDTVTMLIAYHLLTPKVEVIPTISEDIFFKCLLCHTILNDVRTFPMITSITLNNTEDLEVIWDKYFNNHGRNGKFILPSAFILCQVSLFSKFNKGIGGGYRTSIPKFTQAWAKIAPKMLADIAEIKTQRISMKQKQALIWRKVTTTTFIKGENAYLPHFVAFVFLRTLSLIDPFFYDWDKPYVGFYALCGLVMITDGLGYTDAKKQARTLKEDDVSLMIKQFKHDVTKEISQDDEYRGLFRALSEFGVKPFSIQSLEHMLCEYRKVVTKKVMFRTWRVSTETQFYKCVFKYIIKNNSPRHNLSMLYDKLLHLTPRVQSLNQPIDRDRHTKYVMYVKFLTAAFNKSTNDTTKILFRYFNKIDELPAFAEAYLSTTLSSDTRKQIEDDCFNIYLQGMPDVQVSPGTKTLLVANMVRLLKARQLILRNIRN